MLLQKLGEMDYYSEWLPGSVHISQVVMSNQLLVKVAPLAQRPRYHAFLLFFGAE